MFYLLNFGDRRPNYGKVLSQVVVSSLAMLLLCMPETANATGEPFAFLRSHRDSIETVQTEKSVNAAEPAAKEEVGDRMTQPRGERAVLFNLEGSALSEFAGTFVDVTPDGQHVITSDISTAQLYLYSLNGTRLSVIQGRFQGFTPDQQGLITYSQGKSYLYDLNGVEQAALTGVVWRGSGEGDYLEGDYFIVVTGDDRPQFSLYSAGGDFQATFEGFFQGFVPREKKLIVSNDKGSRLHHFDGSLDASFEGVFQAFTPDSKGIVTVADDPTQPVARTLLYDLDGTLKATFEGEFAAFSPDETALVTDSGGLFQSWLYSLEGSQAVAMTGDFIAFSPNGQSLFTYSAAGSHRYTLGGQQQGLFSGRLVGITSDSQRLIVETSASQTGLYDLDGQQLAVLEGSFVGFISDERRIVTSDAGTVGITRVMKSSYRLYDLAGTLQGTLSGQLLGLTATGNQGLVIYGDDGKSHWYDSFDGTEQATFEGRVLGLTPDEQSVFIGF